MTLTTPTPSAHSSQVFAALRSSAPALWTRYTTHPFVHQLHHAILPPPTFLHYLKQDYLFLRHYTRAWALAVIKSTSLLEMRVASQMVHSLGVDELHLHISECASMGVSEQQLWAEVELPQNIAYTRYVLDAGVAGDLVDLLAALIPCVFGYAEIGKRLAGATGIGGEADCEGAGQGAKGHAYRNWIAMYGGREYQEMCERVGGMFDRAVEERLGKRFRESPRWDAVCERFRMGVRLEIGFWDMALGGADGIAG